MTSEITHENLCAVNELVLSACAKFASSNQSHAQLPPIFILTPDRFTLSAEKILLKTTPALLNVRVVTFSMLFNILNQEENKILDKTSSVLFLWKSIHLLKDQLQYFAKSVHQYSFAEKMFNTINQLQSSMADFKTLEKNAKTEITKRKMHDISIIYAKYRELTREYIDGSGALDWLIKHIPNNPIIKSAHIYVTGFEHLSIQRAEVVRLLKSNAKSFVIGVQL